MNAINQKYLNRRFESGAALIFLVFLLVMVGITYIVSTLNSANIKMQKEEISGQALISAKESLIGWSVGNPGTPGIMPCPDTNNDGLSDTCSTYIGRFPWKTVNSNSFRDGAGECLWYAISPIFSSTTNPINSNTAGSISIINSNGTIIASGVIAVIIAPQEALSSQDRTVAGNNTCQGNITASNYLDTEKVGSNTYDNATGNFNITNNTMTFIVSPPSPGFNDKLLYITQEDLYKPLRKRIVREMMGNIRTNTGLYKYFLGAGNYPCPALTLGGLPDCALSTGYFPYVTMSADFNPALGTWLLQNKWFDNSLTTYTFDKTTKLSASVTVGGGAGNSVCNTSSNNVNCQ